MKPRRAILLSAVILLAIPAHASERRVKDGDGSRVPIDIAWIRHGHRTNSHGAQQLVHTIHLHQRWRMKRLRHRGFIHVFFQLPGHPNNPEERTIWTHYKKGELRATMYNTLGDPPGFRARIPVRRPNEKTIKLVFHHSLLRRHLRHYGWSVSAIVESGAPGCPGPHACIDDAPNLKRGKRYQRHNL